MYVALKSGMEYVYTCTLYMKAQVRVISTTHKLCLAYKLGVYMYMYIIPYFF